MKKAMPFLACLSVLCAMLALMWLYSVRNYHRDALQFNTYQSEIEDPFLLNINTASARELESLPAIGKVLSTRIVEYRQMHGDFTSITQLRQVKGISEKVLEEITALITAE